MGLSKDMGRITSGQNVHTVGDNCSVQPQLYTNSLVMASLTSTKSCTQQTVEVQLICIKIVHARHEVWGLQFISTMSHRGYLENTVNFYLLQVLTSTPNQPYSTCACSHTHTHTHTHTPYSTTNTHTKTHTSHAHTHKHT